MTVDLTQLQHAGVITEREAQAIHLHDVKGMTYWQIGLALGLARQTVHERVRRGHEKIERHTKEAA